MKTVFGARAIVAMAAMAAALSVGAENAKVASSPWNLSASAIKTVTIADSRPGQLDWQPDRTATVVRTLNQMLNAATPTVRRLPKSVHATFMAYIGPAVLTVTVNTGKKIQIYPLFSLERTGHSAYAIRYQSGTVVYKRGATVEYLHDPSLYHWLRHSQWQSAFHKESSGTTPGPAPNSEWT